MPASLLQSPSIQRSWPAATGADKAFWETLAQQARIGDNLARFALELGVFSKLDSVWQPAPMQGAHKLCLQNAAVLSWSMDGATYVEGYACTGGYTTPLHHAWELDAEGRVVDPTWEDGLNYLGMPVLAGALHEVLGDKNTWGFFGLGTRAWVVEDKSGG
jgi:hypothetical protein